MRIYSPTVVNCWTFRGSRARVVSVRWRKSNDVITGSRNQLLKEHDSGGLLCRLHFLPAIEPTESDVARAHQAKQQEQDGVLTGQAGLCLGATPEFLVDALQSIRRSQRLPL